MNKITRIIFITVTAVLIISGCSTDVKDDLGSDYLLAGYSMIAGDAVPLPDDAAGSSRATAPTYWEKYKTMTYAELIALGKDGLRINNYPERGQKTYITMTATDDADVFFVSSRTEFPNKKSEVIDYYLEEYYLSDATWGTELWKDGSIVKKENAAWVVDDKARTTMKVVFKDGSERQEWIAEVHSSAPGGTVSYAQFDINGDMTIPTDANWKPAADPTASWSSKVYYYQKVSSWIGWFYKENKEIFGVRYYTQFPDADGNGFYPSSTLIFEHTVSRSSAFWGDDDWGKLLEWIFGDSTSGETLAETVTRESISDKGKKTAVTSTRIVPTFGEAFTIDKSIEYDL